MDSSGLRRRALCLAASSVLGAATVSFAPLRVMRDAPPPAHTGGFNEPTCHACHFSSDVNTGNGQVRLAGVPATYAAGGLYRISAVITHTGLRAGGFQLSARYEDGKQAGTLDVAPSDTARAARTILDGVHYVHHTGAGVTPGAADTIRWELHWTAPQEPGNIIFHIAGNAANDDDSPFGDLIYTTSARTTAGK